MWFPRQSETFVYRNVVKPEEAVLILVPGGGHAPTVVIDGKNFELDAEKTEEVHMFIRVHQRAREES